MDPNLVEFFAMPNRPQDATFALRDTLPGGFPLQITIATTGSSSFIISYSLSVPAVSTNI